MCSCFLLGLAPYLVQPIVSGEAVGRWAITVARAAVRARLSPLPEAGHHPPVPARPHPPPALSLTS